MADICCVRRSHHDEVMIWNGSDGHGRICETNRAATYYKEKKLNLKNKPFAEGLFALLKNKKTDADNGFIVDK